MTARAPLELVAYDPAWPAAFEAEAARLGAALGSLAVRIDHHGSTSVPGLAAKPVIDIQVSVASLQPMSPYLTALRGLGYVHVPHHDDACCPFFHRPAEWPHTHHVHVVEAGGPEERRTLAFRDHLRAHADAAREYEHLKRSLLPLGDHEAYARAKTPFVERILAETGSVSLRTAILTAVFCTIASGLYAAARVEPLPIVSLFLSVGPLIAVILWLQADAHRTQVAAVHDLGLFLWFAWTVVIPWYAWKTRGRAGGRLALGLFALIVSAYVGQVLVALALNLRDN